MENQQQQLPVLARGLKPVRIPFDSEEEWLELRGHGIGGSDIGAVVGFNRHRTALEVWMQKTGLAAPPDLSDNDAVEMGKLLEEPLLRLHEKRTGDKIHRVHAILSHPLYPWMRCSLDGRVVGKPWIAEAKTVGFWAQRNGDWGEEESDAIPLSYMAQVQWSIGVADADAAVIPVLIAGQRYKRFFVERNDELIGLLMERGQEFWQSVEAAIPLVMKMNERMIEGFEKNQSEINALREKAMSLAPASQNLSDAAIKYAVSVEGQAVEANEEIIELERRWREISAQEKAAEKEKEILAARISDYMGAAEVLTHNGEPIHTWKTQSREELNRKLLREKFEAAYDACSYENSFRVHRAKASKKGNKAA